MVSIFSPDWRNEILRSLSAIVASTVSTANAGALTGFRNKIINGGFDVWQRGTSVAVTSGYGPDRWRIQCTAGLTCTATKNSGGPAFYPYAQFALTGTGAAGTSFQQRIEGVRTLAGKQATVRFWLGAGTAQNVNVWLRQKFGTGGSPSADVLTLVGTVATGVGFTVESKLTVNIPTISGKTLGSNGDDSLELFFETTQANAQTYYLARVSLSEGDTTAETDSFSPRHIQQEIALCNRYYWTAAGVPVLVYLSDTTFRRVMVQYPVLMRAAPTVGSLTLSAAGTVAGQVVTTQAYTLTLSAVAAGGAISISTVTFDAEL